ncbi:MAG: holo-ACP synthase [Proteobacteria bacterium]|jgi:holo-[acyl-carrier protein] synthase|nr:holo-ACP synthase [Pseudomonadota bacterium]MCH8138709.1 holo-ACP synthase [Pseudomonadota bacterium]MCH8156127.1 holo-ACP synthase [Pseudomonadota bacterium]
MIIGLGNDLIDIRRIEKTLERFGARFTARVFTETEQRKSDRRATRAASYAKRFAAKEACAKALGTGVPRRGVHWRDLGVVNLPSGKPTMELTRGAARRLEEITPDGMTAQIDVTLTDDYPLAQAIVIISARPNAQP